MTPALSDVHQVAATVSMTVVSLLLIANAGRYRTPLQLRVLDDLPAILTRLVAAMSLIATVVAVRSGSAAVVTFLQNCAMVVVLVTGGRAMAAYLIGWGREQGYGVRRALMVGGGTLAAELADVLDNHPGYGLAVVGYVDDGGDRAASDLLPRLGPLSDVDKAVRTTGAEVLIVTPEAGAECALLGLLRTPGSLGCDIFAVPRLYHLHVHPAPIDRIGSVPVVRVLPPKLSGPWRAIRRVADATVAGGLLALLLPVLCASRISGRAKASRQVAMRLWWVLRGDIGLVGPHPDHFVGVSSRYECYRLRRRARAGLTGLAQINGQHGYVSAHERARYDNWYIENWSLWLDLKIVVSALSRIVAGR